MGSVRIQNCITYYSYCKNTMEEKLRETLVAAIIFSVEKHGRSIKNSSEPKCRIIQYDYSNLKL